MAERRLRVSVVSDGACTDAVAIDERDRILSSATLETAPGADAEALRAVLAHDAVDPADVRWVMLGGGHALADVARAPGLRKVAVVRIGAPLTLAVPPLVTWPAALRAAVSAGEIVVGGGAEFDGRTVTELDEDAIGRFLGGLGDRAQAVAVSGVFAPASSEHELTAAAIVRRELGSWVHIALSYEMGSIGLLERENATVLNAALGGAAEQLAATARETLNEAGVDAELFFTQNDGTLMLVTHAQRFPALMVASGPGTIIRGAAHLSGVADAVVAGVGASTTHVGVLADGMPREQIGATQIAGVPTSLRLPDVRSVAFGSERPTADALAALVDAVAEARTAEPATPLVAVGPGHRLLPAELSGVSEVIRPRDAELAHAVGAALANVGGQFARVCLNRPHTRRAVLEEVRAAAVARAIDAGAHPDRVEVVEVDEVPLTYLVEPAVQIRVRAAGPCW
jgi:N-methylhydantoinase A/oxoprolinase/acetone carboxylase beta subunit